MNGLALQRATESVRPGATPAAPTGQEVLAQRASTFGGGGPAAAPPILDAGRPLDAPTRGAMESHPRPRRRASPR
jgi:hypothetical protein